MKNILAIFSVLISLQSFSQLPTQSSGSVATGSNISIFNNPNFPNLSSRSGTKAISYKDIEGSPYINNNTGANKNLPIGKFYSKEFNYLDTALARYNAYTDQMEVSLLKDGVDYYLLRKQEDFIYIVLNTKTYRAYNYKGSLGFFVLVSKDDQKKCTLLKKEKVLYKKAEKASSSFVTDTPNSFKKLRDTYYFKFDSKLVEIPKKKKLFYNLFKEKKDEIKDYMTSNKLRTTNEKDLLQISRYYNNLTH